jgi:hypothetical protein
MALNRLQTYLTIGGLVTCKTYSMEFGDDGFVLGRQKVRLPRKLKTLLDFCRDYQNIQKCAKGLYASASQRFE